MAAKTSWYRYGTKWRQSQDPMCVQKTVASPTQLNRELRTQVSDVFGPQKMAIVTWPQTLWRHFTLCILYWALCLQCFDAVGWAAGRASRLVLPFWYRLTRVVPDKGPLNGCVCVYTPLGLRHDPGRHIREGESVPYIYASSLLPPPCR